MTALSAMGAFVRRHDPDRFLATLFAPADRRETLFALYAFHHEIARAWVVTTQPTLALIRLQWWREVIEGADRRHEVATPLLAELAAGRLASGDLLGLLEGFELIEQGFASASDWQAFFRATSGGLGVAAGRILAGAGRHLERMQEAGIAYGAALHLRNQGMWAGALPARPVDAIAEPLAQWARALIGAPMPVPRRVIAAGLVGVLARRDLRRAGSLPLRGLGDRAALMLAAARGRV